MFNELKSWVKGKVNKAKLAYLDYRINKNINEFEKAQNNLRLTMCAYSCTLAGGGSKWEENLSYWEDKANNGDEEASIVIRKVAEFNGEVVKAIHFGTR